MTSDLVRINICDVKVAVPAGAGVEAGMVSLREELAPHRLLRIIIGQPEARAIQVCWSGAGSPRPSTWDLFLSTIGRLGASVQRVVITDVEEGRHFFARLDLLRDEESIQVVCRPSDGLAVAIRAPAAGIFADPKVLDAAGVAPD